MNSSRRSIPRRGNAPAWREVFATLGMANLDPDADESNRARIAPTLSRLSPAQLIALAPEVQAILSQFTRQRRDGIALRGGTAIGAARETGVNELQRFLLVARDLATQSMGRRARGVTDRAAIEELGHRWTPVAREVDLAMRDLAPLVDKPDIWHYAPPPPKVRPIVIIAAVVALALGIALTLLLTQ